MNTIFLQNKYTAWYYSIINHAKTRQLESYTEIHHIIPKSIGGDNTPENLVSLTAREHYICHMLLCKMTQSNHKSKMNYAIWRMTNSGNYIINSRTYEYIRKNHSKFISEAKTGVKRKPFSDKTRKNMSEAHKGLKITLTPEGLEGKKKGGQTRLGQEPWNKGKSNVYSDETIKKMSANFSKRLKGVPKQKSPCPYCNKLVSPHILKRWHGDKCKSLS